MNKTKIQRKAERNHTKKNQMVILELKNTMNKMKINTIEIMNNRLDPSQERICEVEDRSFEII